jgi:hypothetical protein
MTATAGDVRDEDLDLVWWLIAMGRDDREQYREIRDALWALRVERSRCSNIPSKNS